MTKGSEACEGGVAVERELGGEGFGGGKAAFAAEAVDEGEGQAGAV